MSLYRIELFRGANRQHYWRIVHRNRNILATSEGYTRRASAARAAERLAAALRFVQVTEVQS